MKIRFIYLLIFLLKKEDDPEINQQFYFDYRKYWGSYYYDVIETGEKAEVVDSFFKGLIYNIKCSIFGHLETKESLAFFNGLLGKN